MEDGNGSFFIFLTECVFGEGVLLHKPFLILSVFLPHTARGSSKERQCLSACTGTDSPDWAGPYTTQHLFAPAQNITFLPEWEKASSAMSKWTPCRTLPKWRIPCQGTDSCPFSNLKNMSNAAQSWWPFWYVHPSSLYTSTSYFQRNHGERHPIFQMLSCNPTCNSAISKLFPVPIIKGQYAEVHHFFLLPVQLTTRVCAKSCTHTPFS